MALVATVNACSSEDRTKLEMPNFTSFYIGTDETLPSSEVVPTTTNVRPMIPYLLYFSRWEKAKLSDLDAFDLRFVLIDDQETTYYFGDYEDSILIKIMKKGTSKPSYYSIELDLDIVLNKTLSPMYLIESTKADLMSNTFLTADINPRLTNSALSFEIDTEDNIKLKNLFQIEEWVSINNTTDLPYEHEAKIVLSNDKELLFSIYGSEYIVQYQNSTDVNQEIYTYRIPETTYRLVLQMLSEMRSLHFDGPSQLVLEANFKSAYVWLENEVGKYPGWEFSLSRAESDTLKTQIEMDQWLRIEGDVEDYRSAICLYSEDKYSYCFKDYGIIVVQSLIDPSIKEVYFADSYPFHETLLSYWDDPVTPVEVKEMNITIAEILYSRGDGPSPELTDRFALSSSQKSKIETLLRFEEWKLDKNPDKYRFGLYNKYRFESGDGSSILVYNLIETTVFRLQNFDPELGVNGEFFYGPADIFEQLSKYMTATFPKK